MSVVAATIQPVARPVPDARDTLQPISSRHSSPLRVQPDHSRWIGSLISLSLPAGSIATSGLNVYPDGAVDRFANTNPMKRLGDVQDIAQAVVYLSSNSGKFVTGETLIVDGGHTCWGDTEWPGGKPDYFRVT